MPPNAPPSFHKRITRRLLGILTWFKNYGIGPCLIAHTDTTGGRQRIISYLAAEKVIVYCIDNDLYTDIARSHEKYAKAKDMFAGSSAATFG